MKERLMAKELREEDPEYSEFSPFDEVSSRFSLQGKRDFSPHSGFKLFSAANET